MLKYYINILSLAFLITIACVNIARADEITFDNQSFVLKSTAQSLNLTDAMNEYFPKGESRENWTKMLGIYHHPDVSNPIKLAQKFDDEIEKKENCLLLKFIQNKKVDQAVLSYLENGFENGKNFFTYNVYKYEKNEVKGMTEFKYSIKYYFNDKSEIPSIAQKVRDENDKYLEMLITSAIPPIVEKELTSTR